MRNDFEKIIKLIETTKIKKGWFVYYSEITKEHDLDRMRSKRARLVQITNYKRKESKAGIVTYKVTFFDDVAKRTSSRNVRLDQNQKATRGWAFSLNKKKRGPKASFIRHVDSRYQSGSQKQPIGRIG